LKNDPELVDFALGLLRGTRRQRPELDALLSAQADNWSLDRMAVTDRNVLRLAAYEIRHTETPPRVVINEAVNLAKRYGARQSAPFVNGVLDSLLPRHSEPTDESNGSS
jgi:N utilization substance protein B